MTVYFLLLERICEVASTAPGTPLLLAAPTHGISDIASVSVA
jgi:hypothetical protein